MPLGTSIPPRGLHYPSGVPQYPSCPQTLWLPPEATSQQLWGLEPAGRYGVRLWGRGGDPQTAPLEATFDTREWGNWGGWGGIIGGVHLDPRVLLWGWGYWRGKLCPLEGGLELWGAPGPPGAFGGQGWFRGRGTRGGRVGLCAGATQVPESFWRRGGYLGGVHNQAPGAFGCWCPGVRGHLDIWVL